MVYGSGDIRGDSCECTPRSNGTVASLGKRPVGERSPGRKKDRWAKGGGDELRDEQPISNVQLISRVFKLVFYLLVVALGASVLGASLRRWLGAYMTCKICYVLIGNARHTTGPSGAHVSRLEQLFSLCCGQSMDKSADCLILVCSQTRLTLRFFAP